MIVLPERYNTCRKEPSCSRIRCSLPPLQQASSSVRLARLQLRVNCHRIFCSNGLQSCSGSPWHLSCFASLPSPSATLQCPLRIDGFAGAGTLPGKPAARPLRKTHLPLHRWHHESICCEHGHVWSVRAGILPEYRWLQSALQHSVAQRLRPCIPPLPAPSATPLSARTQTLLRDGSSTLTSLSPPSGVRTGFPGSSRSASVSAGQGLPSCQLGLRATDLGVSPAQRGES